MNDTLKTLFGVHEEPKGEKCAYKYRVQELQDNDIDIPEDDKKCEYCSGYPLPNGCPNYTTLIHLTTFYETFRRTEDGV